MGNTTPTNQNWILPSGHGTQHVERFPWTYQVEANSPISGRMYTDNSERLVGSEYNDLHSREFGRTLSMKYKPVEDTKFNHYPSRTLTANLKTTAKTAQAEHDKNESHAQPRWSVERKHTAQSESVGPNCPDQAALTNEVDGHRATSPSPLSFSKALLGAVCASSMSVFEDSSPLSTTKGRRRRGHHRASIVFAGGAGKHVEIFTAPAPVW